MLGVSALIAIYIIPRPSLTLFLPMQADETRVRWWWSDDTVFDRAERPTI